MRFPGLFALLLIPASSALRLPATRLPFRRSGRPVAQASPDDHAEDAASTVGKGFGPPRQPTDLETVAAVSRGQKALDAMREQAGAPMVPKAEPEAYIPTQEEKARADRSSAVPFGH